MGTGDRGRYFEVEGVPEGLCQLFSPRSREVAHARAEVERELGVRLQGGALGVLAKETRQAKDHDIDPGRLRQVWDALGQEHGFGAGSASKLRRRRGRTAEVETRMREAQRVVLAQLREQGPTVSFARARALVFEAAAGRLSADEAARLLARMECEAGGELLALEGGRVTSREIRDLERHVMDVAASAGTAGADEPAISPRERAAGLAAAEAALGEAKRLDREQRQALELLTGNSGWVCLSGRAGTGKGPTLHAAAAAYRAAGWRVIACAMDGTTARRMAEQLGGQVPALTVEQLKVRLEAGTINVEGRTVIFVDEASKLDTGHWGELAKAVEHRGARLRAIGHDGQHEAIRLPGLFAEMLREPRIPRAELCQIRRHRNPENPAEVHPWLRDYQVAVDEGRGVDAVAILREHEALKLYDTRVQAMGGMVQAWDRWRRRYDPTESALIVHGPNPDVDLVNELAQQTRLEAGELGEQAVRAVDRDYLLRPGDVVAIRNAAYTLGSQQGRPRPKRVENGQVAIVESVDPKRDTLTLLLREPGAEPRLVEIDHARLRLEHAVGKRAAAVRLNYAMHPFPAQGATVHGTATLAGHWSQAKQETYVGDTRAIYGHSVHVAREDLGIHGTDEDRIGRYAQRIAENRHRQASIRCAVVRTMHLAIDLPHCRSLPLHEAASSEASRALEESPEASAASHTHQQRRARHGDRLKNPLCEPSEHLLRALGPVPTNRVARERWEREAQRLQALRIQCKARQQTASPATTPTPTIVTQRPTVSSSSMPVQPGRPTLRR